MLPPPPRFENAGDIQAFAATPLEQRLRGKDLVALIRDAAAVNDAAVALDYFPTGKPSSEPRRFTRGELVRSAAAFAAELRHGGIADHAVVASLLINGPGTIAAVVGTLSAAVLAPINIFLEAGQIRKLLAECGATAVLVPHTIPAALAPTFASLRETLDENGPKVIEVDTDALLACKNPSLRLPERRLSETVALFHTGGTTGLPKFVPLTGHHIAAMAVISQFAYGYNESDNILCAMPMFHVGGLFACSLFPLASGARVCVLGPLGFRGEGVVAALPDTIASIGATVVIGPPTVNAQLSSNPPDTRKARRLRLFVNGAAALPRILGERLTEGTGVRVVEPWGLTESTLAVTSGPRDGTVKQGSVGLVLPYCEVKAVRIDVDGQEAGDCGTDEIGVLAIRGPIVFDGYLNRPASQQPFFRDGWLDTGDLGRIDVEGFVWVTGRAKELIKRGGHGIDPGMIEDALQAHDDVALVAAVGRPDAYAGEIPIAFVQPRPGTTVDPAALIEFARARIPERAAVPKEIVIVEKLPLTAVGKVHKQTLKLDATRCVAEEVVRDVAGATAFFVSAEPDSLHGLVVRVRASKACIGKIEKALAAFTFRSEIQAIEGGV